MAAEDNETLMTGGYTFSDDWCANELEELKKAADTYITCSIRLREAAAEADEHERKHFPMPGAPIFL